MLFFQDLVQYTFSLFMLLAAVAVVRYLHLRRGVKKVLKRTEPCRTVIVMGSGGHTSEMIRIVGGLNIKHHTPRLYIIADGDKMSQEKVKNLEESNKSLKSSEFQIKSILRARQVSQSYFTSLFTTLAAIINTFSVILCFRPDLVLCNGPGTCIPVCFWAYLLKFVGLKAVKIIYVESLCRVRKLSLSGMILYYSCVADNMFVQWPQLKKLYPRTEYLGRVV